MDYFVLYVSFSKEVREATFANQSGFKTEVRKKFRETMKTFAAGKVEGGKT